MKKGTTLWDLIKAIFGFFLTKRKDKKDKKDEQKYELLYKMIIEADKIQEKLNEGYQKIDEEKEELKKEEDLDSVQNDLNNMF